ncbi:MAG: DUF2202 domain-containing protein [Chitinophagaceae bacterium]|nr:DUF2202 domain-containing protein [Chitinophagaceae bacterium]
MKAIILAIVLAIASTATMAQLISENEKSTILQMREEEKMSRDVYLTLNEKWNQKVFANTAESESYHMTQVELLIEKYKLEDPVAVNEDNRGLFSDNDLQVKYVDLVAAGSVSLQASFRTAAKVEEMDILDLRIAIANSTDKEITGTYNYLLHESESHLVAFVRNLDRLGILYQPVILSKEDFNEIMNRKGI